MSKSNDQAHLKKSLKIIERKIIISVFTKTNPPLILQKESEYSCLFLEKARIIQKTPHIQIEV